MDFEHPFIKLPIQFDAEALEREVRALPQSSWVPHPTGFVGNEAVRLVTVGGEPTDGFEGPMRPTDDLERCPYVAEVMAELDGVWSRSRFMGLGPGAEVPEHVDSHYHWRTHIRIHIPVITDPKVLFTCGGETVHMAAGECWLFDSFRFHRVKNGWTERRVHLVLDTVMTESIQDLVDAAHPGMQPKHLKPGAHPYPELKFEQINASPIMSPWEIRCHLAFIMSHTVEHPRLPQLRDRLNRFADAWAAAWAQFGSSDEGVPSYQRLLAQCRGDVVRVAAKDVALRNRLHLKDVLDSLIFGRALAPNRVSEDAMASVPRRAAY